MGSLDSNQLRGALARHRTVPVVAGDFSPEQAVGLAQALLAGGVTVMERPLRGDIEQILAGIKEVRRAIPEMIIGAGTITDVNLLVKAFQAGAQFGVSPGAISAELNQEIQALSLPFIPGVLAQNSLEGDQQADLEAAQKMFALGYHDLKWFNAAQSGGVEGLRAFLTALPAARWVPMGSIEESAVQTYVDVPAVLCTGGSWVAPLEAIRSGNWSAITERAHRAVR